MSQRNGPQGALKPLKRTISPLLSSVFPILCCIARQRMLVYSPDCMPGGQKQTTEWRRLLRHRKTSRDVGKLTLHWPRFVFAHLQYFKSLSLVQSNKKQPVSPSYNFQFVNKQMSYWNDGEVFTMAVLYFSLLPLHRHFTFYLLHCTFGKRFPENFFVKNPSS